MLTAEPRIDRWSIVLVGRWNRWVFSAPWIDQHLVEDSSKKQPIEMEMTIDDPALPWKFSFGGLTLTVQNGRIAVGFRAPDESILTAGCELASAVLRKLPHTPLKAVGVNYEFLVRNPEGPALEAFDMRDNRRLADAGLTVIGTTVVRKLAGSGHELNFRMTVRADSAVEIGFNFHCDTPTVDDGLKFLGQGIVGFRDRAAEILKDAYSIEFTEPFPVT